ncbi:MAG: hypothetical protein ACM3NQ_07835 [Bacteroidales bacterium]
MKSRAWVGVTLIKIACVYLMAALLVGMLMAIRHDFSLVSVHTHIALLGWTTMAIAGGVYVLFPRCANTGLAGAHFWLHNIGLPIMMAGLAARVLSGDQRAEPLVAFGSVLVILGLLAFTTSVARNARIPAQEEASVDMPR